MTLLAVGLIALALVVNILFINFVTNHSPIVPDGFGE
jgi:hypothetical protein